MGSKFETKILLRHFNFDSYFNTLPLSVNLNHIAKKPKTKQNKKQTNKKKNKQNKQNKIKPTMGPKIKTVFRKPAIYVMVKKKKTKRTFLMRKFNPRPPKGGMSFCNP